MADSSKGLLDAFYDKIAALEAVSDPWSSNIAKRTLYNEAYEVVHLVEKSSDATEEEKLAAVKELEKLSLSLEIQPRTRRRVWPIRLVAFFVYILLICIFVSPFLLLLTSLEDTACWCGMSPTLKVSPTIKQATAWWALLLLGIDSVAEGPCPARLQEPVVLMFTHVSNLDAFLILRHFPCGFKALAKAELLRVPLIGIMAAAYGCVPIERRNRARALGALTGIAESAARSRDTIAVAPEGTRSKTGQLLPFKKGAFHLQEDLGWEVLPLAIHGAFELCPPSSLPVPGKVVVRFLPMIPPHLSREATARRVRDSMQAALQDIPVSAGASVSPRFRAMNVAAVLCTFWLAWRAYLAAAALAAAVGVSLPTAIVVYTIVTTLLVEVGMCKPCRSGRKSRTNGSGDGGKRERTPSSSAAPGHGSADSE